jgi:calpain-15
MDFSKIDMGEFGRHLFSKILKATASDGTYSEVMTRMQKSGGKYTDESFPPNEYSLINDWEDYEVQSKVREFRRIKWIRASEVPDLIDRQEGSLEVFKGGVHPDDIKQGSLGDCYFLSPLSVLSENPDRIRKLFVTDKANQFGVYAVRIFKNGEWKEVVIDDYIPCLDGLPYFSRANGNELWVILLEKAWAKLHGSYERIEAGFAEHVFHDLTGAPSDVYETSQENLFDKMREADQKGWIMAASAGNNEIAQAQLERIGLVGGHSYGLLGVVELTDMFGDTVQLVKLRNPWGNFEWNGAWSDNSGDWTPELQKQAGWTVEDDGTFFMCMDDLRQYFNRIQVCRINDAYKDSSLKARHKHGGFSMLRFVVAEPGGHGYLQVIQTDERCFDRKVNYEYSNVRLIVCKIEDPSADVKKLRYLNGKSGYMRDTWEEYQNLEPGEYYMYVEFDWPDKSEHTDFCASYYGSATAYFLRDEAQLFSRDDLLA